MASFSLIQGGSCQILFSSELLGPMSDVHDIFSSSEFPSMALGKPIAIVITLILNNTD